MKKKIIVLILCLTLLGCTKTKEKPLTKTTIHKEEENYIEPYIDTNPITVGLYINQNNKRYLTNEYKSDFPVYQDIVSLEVYYTNETELSGSQKNIWNQYYSTYQEIDNYKIGYIINFKTNDIEVNKTILSPKDVESFFDYVQIYLYDDIHQESTWYDHIKEEEVKEETLYTSIKLTGSTRIKEIISPITVTAFTYQSNDIDIDGNYKGKNKYITQIIKE